MLKDTDGIFHQAGVLDRLEINPGPGCATNEINARGTLNVLRVARDCGVKKVMNMSSLLVEGDTPTQPNVEGMRPNPKSPYAVSKLAGKECECTRTDVLLLIFSVDC